MADDEEELGSLAGASMDGDGDDDDDEEDDGGGMQAVTVVIRVRPLLRGEDQDDYGTPIDPAVQLVNEGPDCTTLNVQFAREGTGQITHECSFDRVLGMDATQADVFDGANIGAAVRGVVHGISACFFAYGQTSAGKTHTMLGLDGGKALDSGSQASWGVIPRAMDHLFATLAKEEAGIMGGMADRAVSGGSFQYVVTCSMLQIYNEQIHDLLSLGAQAARGDALKIRESAGQVRRRKMQAPEIFVAGLSQYRVAATEDVLELIKHGTRARSVRSTEYNEASSRSHAIVQVVVETETVAPDGTTTIRRGKLSLVDLAGSEKMNTAKTAPTMTKRHVQELTSINRSLSALGNVIAVLADISVGKEKTGKHVPYRDSKLTRLLQDCLGGSTRTVVIGCIAPSPGHAQESISTLKFADRARKVMARVRANEVVDDKVLLVRAYAEIKKLKRLVASLRQELAETHSQPHSQPHGSPHRLVQALGNESAASAVARAAAVTMNGAGPVSSNSAAAAGAAYVQDVQAMLHRLEQLEGENAALHVENKRLRKQAPHGSPEEGRGSRPSSRAGKPRKSRSRKSLADSDEEEPDDAGDDVDLADLEFSQPLLSAELATRAARDYEATYGSFVGDSEIDGDARVLLDELRRDIHMVDTAEMSGRDRRRRRRQLLVAAHQGCRKTVREESQRLDHMRSEREELEAQLAAMMGGQEQDGAAMGEYIDEHGEDQEEAAEVRNGNDDDEIDENDRDDSNRPEITVKALPRRRHKRASKLQSGSGGRHRGDANGGTHGDKGGVTVTRLPKAKKSSSFANLMEPEEDSQPVSEAELRAQRAQAARAIAARAGLAEQRTTTAADIWPSPVHTAKRSRSQTHVGHKARVLRSSSRRERESGEEASEEPLKQPEKDEHGLYHSMADLGLRVQVYSYRHDAFYDATVVSYDGKRGMHCCQYDDGDKQWHDLLHKTFRVLEESGRSTQGTVRNAISAPVQGVATPNETSCPPIDSRSPGALPSHVENPARATSSHRKRISRSAAAQAFLHSPYLQDPAGFQKPPSRGGDRSANS